MNWLTRNILRKSNPRSYILWRVFGINSLKKLWYCRLQARINRKEKKICRDDDIKYSHMDGSELLYHLMNSFFSVRMNQLNISYMTWTEYKVVFRISFTTEILFQFHAHTDDILSRGGELKCDALSWSSTIKYATKSSIKNKNNAERVIGLQFWIECKRIWNPLWEWFRWIEKHLSIYTKNKISKMIKEFLEQIYNRSFFIYKTTGK